MNIHLYLLLLLLFFQFPIQFIFTFFSLYYEMNLISIIDSVGFFYTNCDKCIVNNKNNTKKLQRKEFINDTD